MPVPLWTLLVLGAVVVGAALRWAPRENRIDPAKPGKPVKVIGALGFWLMAATLTVIALVFVAERQLLRAATISVFVVVAYVYWQRTRRWVRRTDDAE